MSAHRFDGKPYARNNNQSRMSTPQRQQQRHSESLFGLLSNSFGGASSENATPLRARISSIAKSLTPSVISSLWKSDNEPVTSNGDVFDDEDEEYDEDEEQEDDNDDQAYGIASENAANDEDSEPGRAEYFYPTSNREPAATTSGVAERRAVRRPLLEDPSASSTPAASSMFSSDFASSSSNDRGLQQSDRTRSLWAYLEERRKEPRDEEATRKRSAQPVASGASNGDHGTDMDTGASVHALEKLNEMVSKIPEQNEATVAGSSQRKEAGEVSTAIKRSFDESRQVPVARTKAATLLNPQFVVSPYSESRARRMLNGDQWTILSTSRDAADSSRKLPLQQDGLYQPAAKRQRQQLDWDNGSQNGSERSGASDSGSSWLDDRLKDSTRNLFSLYKNNESTVKIQPKLVTSTLHGYARTDFGRTAGGSSETRRILEELDRMATPVRDAKQIPIRSYSPTQFASPGGFVDAARASVSSKVGPPKLSLNLTPRAQVLPRLSMFTRPAQTQQKKTELLLKASPAGSDSSDKQKVSTDFLLRTSQADLGSNEKQTAGGGKMRPVLQQSARATRNTFSAKMSDLEEPDDHHEEEKLPHVPFPPIASAPKSGFLGATLQSSRSLPADLCNLEFSFAKPKVLVPPSAAPKSVSLSAGTKSTDKAILEKPAAIQPAPAAVASKPVTEAAASWSCVCCCASNAATKSACSECFVAKPAEQKAPAESTADWICVCCSTPNPSNKTGCSCCFAPRPAKKDGAAAAIASGKPAFQNFAAQQPATGAGASFQFGFSSSTAVSKPAAAESPAPTTPVVTPILQSSPGSAFDTPQGVAFGLQKSASTALTSTPLAKFGQSVEKASTPIPTSTPPIKIQPAKEWECPTCLVKNQPSATACSYCFVKRYPDKQRVAPISRKFAESFAAKTPPSDTPKVSSSTATSVVETSATATITLPVRKDDHSVNRVSEAETSSTDTLTPLKGILVKPDAAIFGTKQSVKPSVTFEFGQQPSAETAAPGESAKAKRPYASMTSDNGSFPAVSSVGDASAPSVNQGNGSLAKPVNVVASSGSMFGNGGLASNPIFAQVKPTTPSTTSAGAVGTPSLPAFNFGKPTTQPVSTDAQPIRSSASTLFPSLTSASMTSPFSSSVSASQQASIASTLFAGGTVTSSPSSQAPAVSSFSASTQQQQPNQIPSLNSISGKSSDDLRRNVLTKQAVIAATSSSMFGASSATPPTFSFGGASNLTSQASTVSSSSFFTSIAKTTAATPASVAMTTSASQPSALSPFSFGASKPATSTPSASFSFGAPQTSTATSSPIFGASSIGSLAPSSSAAPSLSFGASLVASPFGAAATTTTGSSSMFRTTTPATTTSAFGGGFAFGGGAASTTPSVLPSIFGSIATSQPAPAASFSFGGAKLPAAGGGLFSSASTGNLPSFGAAASVSPASTAAPTAPAPTFSFSGGQAAASQPAASFSFGSAMNAPQTVPVFGAPQTQAPATAAPSFMAFQTAPNFNFGASSAVQQTPDSTSGFQQPPGLFQFGAAASNNPFNVTSTNTAASMQQRRIISASRRKIPKK